MTSDTEVAWAAGFFDGEGHTGRASGRWLRLQVGQQKGRETLDRFKEAMGVGSVQGPWNDGMYQYQTYGPKAFGVLQTLWPYLSNPKKEQAVAAVLGTNLADKVRDL